MFTPLEKVQINFPDILFQEAYHVQKGDIVRATVPNVYVLKRDRLRTKFSDSACAVNKCLVDCGARERVASFLEPLSVVGEDSEECADKLIEAIESKNVLRHALTNKSSVFPEEGIPYFHVKKADFFHRHGDPEFMDMSPIKHRKSQNRRQNRAVSSLEVAVAKIKMEDDGLPKDLGYQYPEDGVITFDVTYSKQHRHYIGAATLAQRLEA